MPLFYFDLSNGTREPDEDGSELASFDDAQTQAVRLLGEMLTYDARPIWEGHGLAVEVFDAVRTPLFAVKVAATGLYPGP